MSRRDQIRMTDEERRAFLDSQKTIVLTSVGPEGFPHPMPMWFALDDDGSVRMTTFRKSQKVKNIQRDPRVSLLAESGVEYAELRGVVLYGRAELIDDLETVKQTLLDAAGREVTDPEARAAMDKVMTATAAKRVCIRVAPDRVVSWDHRKLRGVY